MPLTDFKPQGGNARNYPRQVPAVRPPPPAEHDAADDSKEELDSVPDMPAVEAVGGPGQQPFARRYSGIGNSMARLNSTARAAGSLQQTMRRMNASGKEKGFIAEVSMLFRLQVPQHPL